MGDPVSYFVVHICTYAESLCIYRKTLLQQLNLLPCLLLAEPISNGDNGRYQEQRKKNKKPGTFPKWCGYCNDYVLLIAPGACRVGSFDTEGVLTGQQVCIAGKPCRPCDPFII